MQQTACKLKSGTNLVEKVGSAITKLDQHTVEKSLHEREKTIAKTHEECAEVTATPFRTYKKQHEKRDRHRGAQSLNQLEEINKRTEHAHMRNTTENGTD